MNMGSFCDTFCLDQTLMLILAQHTMNYEKYLDYIEKHWDKMKFELLEDEEVHIALPNPFIAPNENFFGKDQFYWDSYFIILGLVESGTFCIE